MNELKWNVLRTPGITSASIIAWMVIMGKAVLMAKDILFWNESA